MKKLKIFLIVLTSILSAVLLISCSSDEHSDANTNQNVSTTSSKSRTDKDDNTDKSSASSKDNSNETNNGDSENDKDNVHKLSFKSTLSYDYLKKLDGEEVTINGYLATSSPVDGSFIFLMNMPYQSCPFCVPNTTELSNTIEVYPEKGEKFSYTMSAVKVTGTLEVAPDKNQPFKDPYGYEFNFKIVDASYEILTSEDMGTDFGVWEKFAQSGVIDELYKMYDYVDFVCKWNEYFVNSYVDANGTTSPGYYLWPSDAKNYLEKSNMKYGTDPNYFTNLIAKIEAIDKDAFSDLVKNVKEAEALAKIGYNKLYNGEYTYEYKYVEKFDTSDNVYTINGGEQLKEDLNSVFKGFQEWLGSWEL